MLKAALESGDGQVVAGGSSLRPGWKNALISLYLSFGRVNLAGRPTDYLLCTNPCKPSITSSTMTEPNTTGDSSAMLIIPHWQSPKTSRLQIFAAEISDKTSENSSQLAVPFSKIVKIPAFSFFLDP